MGDNSDTFNELLEQALGTPEPGAVNFNILRQLISALLRRLNLSNASAADADSTSLSLNLAEFQTRLSSLEELVNRLDSQSHVNQMKQETCQRINNLDSELQKTLSLVNDLSKRCAALQAKQSTEADAVETAKNISIRVEEMEQSIKDLSQILGIQKEDGQVTSVLSESERSISELQQRFEQVENALGTLNESKLLSSDSDAFVALSERVEGLNDLVISQLPNQDDSGDVPKSNLKVCIESLKMVIGDVKEDLNRMDDVVKNVQDSLASVVQEKVSKSDLEDALHMIEAKNDNASADERNEFKEAVNTLKIDVADVCQRVIGIERFIKTNFSRLTGQLKEKAEKSELTAAQARMTSELQKFALRLKLPTSNLLLNNGRLRNEAAGIRKKMILHCISCDRPLLIGDKRRGNYQANYIDPPYVRHKNGIYDVYRMKRGTGGVFTTVKTNEVKPPTPKAISGVTSSSQIVERDEQNKPAPQTSVNQNIEDTGLSEILTNLDVALPEETGTIAPLTSPQQSDDEADLPEL